MFGQQIGNPLANVGTLTAGFSFLFIVGANDDNQQDQHIMATTATIDNMESVPIAPDFAAMTSQQMIVATLNLFCGDGVVEIRCLDACGRKKRTDSGYFDDFTKAARLAQQYVKDGCTKGVYFVLNPFSPDLLARAANRFDEWATTTTSDAAITSRRWFYVDCDPVRPAGISSTDEQVQMALQKAADVAEWMRSQGLCDPITAMSGNGAHLPCPIYLPNDPDSLAIVSGVLRTLDSLFTDDQVSIDTTVSNAARIGRLYGTVARKGDSTADRPHRMAKILSVPDYLKHKTGDVCNVDALRAVAAMSEPSTKTVSRPISSTSQSTWPDRRLLPELYLRDCGLEFIVKTKGEFTDYVLSECPFNSDHKSPDSMFTQGSNGGVQFKCLHDSCAGNKWEQMKAAFPPKSEHWDRPYQAPVRTQASEVTPFLEGERVRSADRGNVGTVIQDDGGPTVRVEFKGKDGVATLDKPRSTLTSLDGAKGEAKTPELVFHDAWQAAFNPRKMRECIIEGLLRREEVGNVIASTKTGKSWFALLLLICVAIGRDWFGRRVARGNVLLIDNELHEETIENRIAAVRDRMDIRHDTPRDRFEYIACRGDWISIQDLIEEIPKQHPPGSLNLIVIDAKYRLFGNGLEENSNDDQTTFHNLIDKFAKEMNCPILLVHHATKGDQSGKAVTDVGSGGGSQSRAVDLHMTIRPHQQPGLAVLDAAVRSFAPVEPVTLRWNWPVWSVAEVEPLLPKDSKDTERFSVMKAKVLKYLSVEWQSLTRLAERCSTKKDRNPFSDIIDGLQREKIAEVSETYVPPRSNKETTGIRLTSDKTTPDNCPGSLSDVRG